MAAARVALLPAIAALVGGAAPPATDAAANSSMPEPDFAAIASEAQSASGQISAEAMAQHAAWTADFARRSWEWHLLSTKIIFIAVLLIVAFGVLIAWLQFRTDSAPKISADASGPVDNGIDISVSAQSVSVKSKTIGAVVLVFSGVFFFLYLSIVYPMTVVAPNQAVQKKLP